LRSSGGMEPSGCSRAFASGCRASPKRASGSACEISRGSFGPGARGLFDGRRSPIRPAGCAGMGSCMLRDDADGLLTVFRLDVLLVLVFAFAVRVLPRLTARFLVFDFLAARFPLRAMGAR